MNICLLNESFPPVIDGVANVVMNYADALIRDHSASVIVGTPRYPDADYSRFAYPVVAYPSIDTASVTNGYRTGNPFTEKALDRLAQFFPDIIHSHGPASATIIARLLREKTNAPVVFTYHTKYDIDIKRVVHARLVADETIAAMVGNIEACDEVWTVSRGAGESLRALGFQGDYRVMNNGVDFPKGRMPLSAVLEATAGYDLPEGVPVFLYVGRMISYKGLPLLLDALKLLSGHGTDFRMVFIGKGPDQALLEEKAKSLGLTGNGNHPDQCIFVGPVYDRDVLRSWNTRADLFLFPSTFDTNGLVVREAAACGLASVLIEGSCAAEGVTDGRNGFTVRETPEAVARLLEQVCGDLDHLREIGGHAMDELYLSWKECVGRAYQRYEVILENWRSGTMPERKRQPTDSLVRLTAKTMEQSEQFRNIGADLLRDFRETAGGMMENFQETEETAVHFLEQLTGNLYHGMIHKRKE